VTPDEEVQKVLTAISQMRARHAAFAVAADQLRHEQFHEAVTARWDGEGNLKGLEIAPNALRDYTHTELEDIIGEVMRRTRTDMGQRFEALFEKYLGYGSPGFDPDILGVPHVGVPSAAT
jgi:DNA-binding protein YbaB